MATSTSPVFSGQSSFSADFQQVLSRAVAIASLPMQTMQNTITTLTGQEQALGNLQSVFATLQNDIASVNSASQGSPAAQSSQSSAVQATASAGALSGTYSIEVDNIGSSASALSQAGTPPVTDPTIGSISSASTFTLTAGGTTYTIKPSGASLEDLASAINTSGASVQATIVNLGSNTSPDYRLAVSDTSLGPDTIQLSAGATNLLNPLSPGTYSSYKVNGSTTPIQGTSSQVTLSPGLTATLTQQTTSGTPAVITVSTSYTSLSNALSALATDYNSAVAALNQNIGQNGGALTGQSIIYSLKSVLHSITGYTSGSGSVTSLNDLGLSLDQNGNLNFNPSALSSANMTSVQQFLGGSTSGGFLLAASSVLTSFSNSSTGVIQTEITTAENQISNQNALIAQDQTRINDLTNSLQAQLTAADAAIAALQSQKTYLTDLFNAAYPSSTNGTSG